MRTSDQIDRAAQARHLQEALLTRLAKGREWATPGIEAALRRALTGIDTGLEAASPRLQDSLRTIADELAGRVETATPRLHERIAKLIPVTETPAQAQPPQKTTRMLWWFILTALAAVGGGVATWRVMRSVPEPEIAPAPEAATAGPTSLTPPPQAVM
ncbi:hypothetical protein [Arthrobacter globiformis]|uniref:hypothetical protein n=1 Tax=Arthrobacter globiformis TaxID=1665 RepID=UPI0027898D16|nr:hypothetical protein [Arthrobacter globiformis]MDQ0865269.1 hypothetical protein [Arthrobacter globiformis]